LSAQELSTFDNSDFDTGAGPIKRMIWYFVNSWIFNSYLFPFYALKRSLLRIFGAKIGVGVVIKPKVNIKYPWKLSIGQYTWIGEEVWLDNLDELNIGRNVCVSQGALILSGNHNYKKKSFDLITKKIKIEDSAWIGARSLVSQGVTVGQNAILMVASVASADLEEGGIYRGNPAELVKRRVQDED